MEKPAERAGEAFEGKRALVTGGLGFIGSNLAHRLVAAGAQVTILDLLIPESGGSLYNVEAIRDRVRIEIGDIRDGPLVAGLLAGQDFIFNLAGQVSHPGSMQDPQTDLEINAAAHLQILELCRTRNPSIKVVYAGTRQVYGRPRALPVDESHPLDPVDYNGVSKLAAELYHAVCGRVYGLRTTVLRLTNVYGPRMRVRDARQTFIGWWFRQLIEGQALQVYGTGEQLRDLNYVDDVAAALLLCAADPAADGQVYNLGGEPVSLLDLARRMASCSEGGAYELVPFPEERRRIDIGDYHGDYTRIRTQLGWQPQVPLNEGLARTLAFYREQREHYW